MSYHYEQSADARDDSIPVQPSVTGLVLTIDGTTVCSSSDTDFLPAYNHI